MDFRILGPLEVHEEGRALSLGGRQQRALLSLLLLRANEVVPVEQIIDELWPAAPPPSATKSVHALVSKLRRTLEHESKAHAAPTSENGVLLTKPHGYVLRVAPGELDLDRFASLMDDGQRAFTAGRVDEAATVIRRALALWRGRPLEEFAYDSFAQVEIARLEELRLSAIEQRIEADLALGRENDFIAELEALVAKNPLRERLRRQLMLALYRSGRHAEALEAYQRGRRRLIDELGIEPGPALQKLEAQILNQDPALADVEQAARRALDGGAPTPAPPPARGIRLPQSRRSRLAVLGAGLLAVAVAVTGFVAFGRETPPVVQPNSVAVIDPEANRVVDQIRIGKDVGPIAVGLDSVWATNLKGQIARIDPTTRMVDDTIAIPGDVLPADVAIARSGLWIADSSGTVAVVDAATGQLRWRADVGVTDEINPARGEQSQCVDGAVGIHGAPLGDFHGAVAVGAHAVWYACSASLAARIDPNRNRVTEISVNGINPIAIAFGLGSAWVANHGDGTLSRISARTNEVTDTIRTGRAPSAVVVSAGDVWVADFSGDSVTRLDVAESGRGRSITVSAVIPVGDGPIALAADNHDVWVASRDGRVARIDRKSEHVDTVELGEVQPVDIAVGEGQVWVTVQPRKP